MFKKRRREESNPDRQKCKSKTVEKCCILHIDGIQHLDFTPFSKIKVPVHEKLAQLHTIRDKRLEESIESKYRLNTVSRMSANAFQKLLKIKIYMQLVTIEAVTNTSQRISID